MKTMEKEKVKCPDCDMLFRDRFNSWRHYVRIHLRGQNKKKILKLEKPKPVCPDCGHVFYKPGNLKRHLNLCQKKLQPPSSERYEFIDNAKFEEWKRKIESETYARFVRKNHYKLQDGGSKTKYICHRSGYFKPTGKNIRRRKSFGTNKIDGICPARIISLNSAEGKVEVLFFPKHEGHDMELKKMTLTKVERSYIAEQIANHTPFHEILRNVKNSSDPQFQRLKLLTKKDLCNIKKEFNLKNSINNIPCPFEDIAVDYCVNNNEKDSESELAKNKPSRTEIDFRRAVSEALGSCSEDENGSPPSPEASAIPLQNENGLPLPPLRPNHNAQAIIPEDLLSSFTISFNCVENRQVVAINDLDGTEPPPLSIVKVSCPLQSSHKHANAVTDSTEIEKRMDDFKKEMRNKFEQVLNSIKTDNQVEYARKWLESFYSSEFPADS